MNNHTEDSEIEKVLGKITEVEFGLCSDRPFLMGIHFSFSLGNGGGVGDGYKYTINMSEECRWNQIERSDAIVKSIERIQNWLKDAKVHNVSQLLNKPVEVSLKHDCFYDFRILTEVL